jgi:hypothetical protein
LQSAETTPISEEKPAVKNFSFLLNSSVLVAIISSLLGTVLGAFITGWYSLTLERQKYEYSLIQKAIETSDYRQAAKGLNFLIDTGIIKSLNANAIKTLAESEVSSIPVYPPSIPKLSNTATAKFPDYTVFLCDAQWENQSAIDMANKIINSLSSMERVGEIQFKQWHYYSEKITLKQIQNKLTIIVDPYEKGEVKLIKEQLKNIKNLPSIEVVNNPSEETKWRISLILCSSNF